MKSATSKSLGSIDFSKYANLGFESTFEGGSLFPIDIRDAVFKHVCPYCGCKLYEMRNKPLFYCRSVKHRNKFIIDKSKLVLQK